RVAVLKFSTLATYTGTMVRGKFNGRATVVDANGRVFHGTFADGKQKNDWQPGPLVSKAERVESPASTEKPERAETATSTREAPAAEELPAKTALAPGAVRAIGLPPGAISEKPKTEAARQPERIKPEKPKKAAKSASEPAEGSAALTKEKNIERPMPNAAQSPSPSLQPSGNETPVDQSLQLLTGPPAELQMHSPSAQEPNPPAAVSSSPTRPQSLAGAKLTAVQAMDIADIEARTNGYDLGEYQLPKAEYNSATNTWLVAYLGRDGNAEKKLNVTVQDKTGKAEIRK